MKEEIVIKDSSILAVNRSKKENEADAIIYRDRRGKWHTIELESCAKNYQNEKEKTIFNCVGERNTHELYFCFYTSGLKTKVIFKKNYIASIIGRSMLKGTNEERFLQLQKLMDETKYITRNLAMYEE